MADILRRDAQDSVARRLFADRRACVTAAAISFVIGFAVGLLVLGPGLG